MATTKGRRRPKAERDRISKKQKENFLRREEEVVDEPTEKRCSACKKRKPVEEFYKKKRKLASGVVKAYLAGECKICHKRRIDRNIAKLKREGKYTKLNRTRYKKAMSARGDRIREQKRESAAFRRDEEGRLKGYFRSVTSQNGKLGKVDRMPLVNFVLKEIERRGISYEDIARSVEEISASRVAYIIQGWEPSKRSRNGRTEIKRISLHRVDQILRGLDQEEQLTILYTNEVIDAGVETQAQETAEKTAARKKRRKAKRQKERGPAH